MERSKSKENSKFVDKDERTLTLKVLVGLGQKNWSVKIQVNDNT